MDISNDRELRLKYESLYMYTTEIIPLVKDPERKVKLQKRILELKKEIRIYNHASISRRVIKDEGIDGYIELIELPEFISSIEKANGFFEDSIYIPSPSGLYDCTGCPFTRWYKVIRRRGKYYNYHEVGYDV